MLKTIFLGNSDFCMPTLELLNQKTHLLAIVTGLDKPITHRSSSIQEPLPKIYGKEHNIPVLQPDKMKDPLFLEKIKNLNPDLMVIISYGKILPAELFNIPPLGTFNLHASLLPKYRGASPVQEALLHNDNLTGITLQKINEKMDDGNIYWTKEYTLSKNTLYPELRRDLAHLASQTLEELLLYYDNNNDLPSPQLQIGEPSFCGKIKKENGLINFKNYTAQQIYNQFRAFYTWPQTFFTFKDILVKLEEIEIQDLTSQEYKLGTIIVPNKQDLLVQTQKGLIKINRLRPQSKKSQDAVSFMNGYQIKQGDELC